MAKKINVLEFVNDFARVHQLELQNGEAPSGTREPYEGEHAYGPCLFHTPKSKEDYRQNIGSRVQPFRKV